MSLYASPYLILKHSGEIKRWLEVRGMPASYLDDLPRWGIVMEHDHDYVCAGFLRKIENAPFGLMDSIISNPDLPLILRDRAIDALIEALLEIAKDLGMKKIFGMTKLPKMEKRVHRFGFESSSWSWLEKDLRGE